MTLAAPRSRQGKLTLVLAILVVAAAAVGTFLWANSAQADISTTTVALTSNQGATVNAGDTITYTATVTQVGVPGGTITSARFTVNLDSANISSATVTSDAAVPWQTGAECTYVAPTAACVDAAGPVASDTVVIAAVVAAGGDNDVDPPTLCFVDDAGTGQANCTSAIVAVPVNGVTNSGNATVVVGTNSVITFTVPIGLTYCSDVVADTARTFNVSPTVGDMVVVPSTAVVAGPSAGLAATTATDTATVTVTSATAGAVTATLSTHPATSTVITDCTPSLVTITFGTLATVAGGELAIRHVDIDCGTEQDFLSGGNPLGANDYDGNLLPCNGLLSNGDISEGINRVTGFALDDNDDAVGSAHTVCIIGGGLTSADNANISWTITPAAAHQVPAGPIIPAGPHSAKIGVDVNDGPALEACVRWTVGDVGVQQDITATWVPTGETIYSNGVRSSVANPPSCANLTATPCTFDLCPSNISDITVPIELDWSTCQPLIKEWNSILSTRIVQNSGSRDCTTGGACANANLDGEIVTVSGLVSIDQPLVDGNLLVTGREFLEYAFGAHDDYSGPIDGAVQTFIISGTCGSSVIEVPATGIPQTIDVNGPNPSTLNLTTNSDKGVAFTIAPTDDGSLTSTTANADCFDGDSTTITITTRSDTSLLSNDPIVLDSETITINWVGGGGLEKQPMLAWVGQRVVLSHDWSDVDGSCPWYPGVRGDTGPFFVRYLIQTPSPGALSNVPGDAPAVVTGPDYIIVPVEDADNCISHVIYESQNQGRVDVTAHVVSEPTGQPASDFSVISAEYDFWYFYMKLESTTLTASAATSIVSSDVTLSVAVKGWVLADNCPVKAAGADINGLLLPANRCTFPDDWATVVGNDEQFDILGGSSAGCPNVAGPFSLLQEIANCGDSSAPHVNGGVRHSVFPGGGVTALDAPMPPALITLDLTGSGFLHGATKSGSEYLVTHIPAEPQIFVAGSGYLWHTWTGAGDRSGLYTFWTSLAGTGTPIVSCPGTSPCDDGVPTGGFDMIQIYTDNEGKAQALVNGDANLNFAACDAHTAAELASEHGIISPIIGHYCETGDIVGTSSITAVADYPDKKPHRDVAAAGPVTITWTWAGQKEVDIVPGETLGPNTISEYVVFNVLDRDGFCDGPSLHPVLGERVDFLIDSGDGHIIGAQLLGSIAADGQSATTTTFDALGNPLTKGPITNQCQAWVLVSSSLDNPVNVRVTAFDPEGTIQFDTIINPTPVPTAPPPTASPFNIAVKWGNTDCSPDGVTSRDAQAVLKRVGQKAELSQDAPCPTLGQLVIVSGNNQRWGNWDCDTGGITSRDAQAVLKFVGQKTALTQTSPCPVVGADVVVTPISIP